VADVHQTTGELPPRALCRTRLRTALLTAVIDQGQPFAQAPKIMEAAWWTAQGCVNAAAVVLRDVDRLHVTQLGVDEHRYRRVLWFRDPDQGGWRRVEPWMTILVISSDHRNSGWVWEASSCSKSSAGVRSARIIRGRVLSSGSTRARCRRGGAWRDRSVDFGCLCVCQAAGWGVVESRLAGLGSDLSEELVVGVEPVAPDCGVAPECPPGLASWRRSSAIMTRQTWSANRRFRQRFASRRVLPSAIFDL
jgi:hypothetical protein